MVNSTIEKDINDRIARLSLERKKQILKFIVSLEQDQIQGVPGKELCQFAGAIDKDDLVVIDRAIEESCEQVDHDGW